MTRLWLPWPFTLTARHVILYPGRDVDRPPDGTRNSAVYVKILFVRLQIHHGALTTASQCRSHVKYIVSQSANAFRYLVRIRNHV